MPSCRWILLFLILVHTGIVHAAKLTPKPQESFAPYWTSEPGWESELQLRNNIEKSPLTVTPVLRLANGREIVLDEVTIASNAAQSVLVSDALAKHAPGLVNQPGSFGSVAFRFTSGHVRNLYAVVMLRRRGEPIGYHIDAFPVSHPEASARSTRPGSREGIWWLPSPTVKDVLVISNSSLKTVSGKLFLFDSSGKRWSERLTLQGHQTVRMAVADLLRQSGLNGTYGGIKYEVPSHAPALDSLHFLYDETNGFSGILKMFDRDPSATLDERTWAGNKQWTMWAPMLALRSPDPAVGFPAGTTLEPTVFIRNTTAKEVVASITLGWKGESNKGKVELPQLTLHPLETRRLEIDKMQAQVGIPDDAHWALVTLTSSASPDDLMAVAASFDSTGRYGAQTPFSDNLSFYWVGGEWQVDSTHNAIVAVTNGGSRSTDALLTLHYDNGQKKYEIQQSIAAGDQMWLNFGNLIRHSVPDRKGNILPTDLTSGTYDLEDLNPGIGGNLIEGKVVVDKTWGHLTYGCLTCCGYSPYLAPDPSSVGVGNLVGINAMGTNNCTLRDGYNLQNYFNNQYSSWWSGSTSIAKVTTLQGQGVAAGSTNGFARGWQVPDGDGSGFKVCPAGAPQTQNTVPVFQFVVAGNPYIFVGSDPQILTANYFAATDGHGGSPKPAGGTVGATSSDTHDSFQITQGNLPTVKVTTPDQSANNLDRTLTFSYTASGGNSISQTMSVTARKFGWVTNPVPSNQCTLGHGTKQTYVYTVYTRPDNAAVDMNSNLGGTLATENFDQTPQCLTHTGDGSLSGDGEFSDNLIYCGNMPLSCVETRTQTLTVGGIAVRTNKIQTGSNGVTYTNEGPTQ
jgi:hypothetical protein